VVIRFTCPNCEKKLKHPVPNVKVQCDRCSQKILVPGVPVSGDGFTLVESANRRPEPRWKRREADVQEGPDPGHVMARFVFGWIALKVFLLIFLPILGIIGTILGILYYAARVADNVTK
jgi:DNA-directed RNA polymerase subunit RPC12/RpoP